MTLMVKKLLAKPLPNANILILLPWRSVGSMVESKLANPPYNDAVYMLPHLRAHFIEGSTVEANPALVKFMNVFSRALSVKDSL